jgi:hypothetical protein
MSDEEEGLKAATRGELSTLQREYLRLLLLMCSQAATRGELSKLERLHFVRARRVSRL